MIAVAFTGPSNSGKTTLIKKLALKFQEKNKRVSIIKHDPKDKAIFDVKGKDSQIFFETGANVAVISPTRTTLFFHQSYSIDEVAKKFGEFDILMVEGLKWINLPRIGVFRGKIQEDYLDKIQALAIDDSINLEEFNISKKIEILDLNNIDEVAEWILKNGKSLKGE
jgi:molybdopterin-guanine dinucleotide biosynthesis protein B